MSTIKQKATAIDSYEGEKLSGRTETQGKKVLRLLQEKGPLTDQELAFYLQVNPGTVCARRNELVEQLMIRDSGKTKECQFTHKRVIIWEWVGELDLFNSKVPKLSAQKKRKAIMDLCKSDEFKNSELAVAILKILNS